MTKIEITDAMVERACKSADLMWSRDMVRTMLDAALNPPPEPEIEVTKEMLEAGHAAWEKHRDGHYLNPMITDIYRAMRALEPKPKGNIQDDPRWPFHQRAGDAPQYWSHRRSPDMKSTVASDGTIFTTRGASRLHSRSGDRGEYTYCHRRETEQNPVPGDYSQTIFTSLGPARLHNRKNDTGRNSYFHRRAGDPK